MTYHLPIPHMGTTEVRAVVDGVMLTLGLLLLSSILDDSKHPQQLTCRCNDLLARKSMYIQLHHFLLSLFFC